MSTVTATSSVPFRPSTLVFKSNMNPRGDRVLVAGARVRLLGQEHPLADFRRAASILGEAREFEENREFHRAEIAADEAIRVAEESVLTKLECYLRKMVSLINRVPDLNGKIAAVRTLPTFPEKVARLQKMIGAAEKILTDREAR